MFLPEFFDLYSINLYSTTLRLVMAVLLGGLIGIERGVHNRPAGFRTHVLVCVGACLAMLTNQFVFQGMTQLADPTRLGAQVITGVGFLGVGTILVTGRHRIKGLTTAAGLWASACIGLAVGIGYYSGAIIAAILIIIVLAIFPAIENKVYNLSRNIEAYIEVDSISTIKPLLASIRNSGVDVYDVHYGSDSLITGSAGLHISMRIPKGMRPGEIIENIGRHEGVSLIEEL
ncbi:MAG: MgtC/SapB family protein [Clostridiales Family XIII bacterium]|jgi:putative Mg2+ transporter-C (MgtC) family protein|nr:MgtC/SapB family protein [Clostridiales Family XIII bacterium]